MIIPTIKRILCLEDDQDDRELISFMLHQINPAYEILTVEDVSSAVIEIVTHNFDLYILDYRLKETSGVRFCRWIRDNGHTAPVMFYTGMAEPEDREAAIEAGANAYLVKPADFEQFKNMVQSLLKSENRN